MIADPWAKQMDLVIDSVRNGPGALDVDTRRRIMDGAPIGDPLGKYVWKVAAQPATVTDDDVRALIAAGYSEEQIFEATISAALAAGLVRLRAGLAALREADDAA